MTQQATGQAFELVCPKCQAPMRSYERSGVVVDRCTECGGIFLDRGELERLTEAETAYGRPAGDSQWTQRGSVEDRDEPRSRRDSEEPGRRRGGFLGDLLDFGD